VPALIAAPARIDAARTGLRAHPAAHAGNRALRTNRRRRATLASTLAPPPPTSGRVGREKPRVSARAHPPTAIPSHGQRAGWAPGPCRRCRKEPAPAAFGRGGRRIWRMFQSGTGIGEARLRLDKAQALP